MASFDPHFVSSLDLWVYVKKLNINPLVLRLEYSRQTRSTPWLLMPWLLVGPGHQQSWYWLCKTGRSLPPLRKDFQWLLQSWCQWEQMQIYFWVFSGKFSSSKVNWPWWCRSHIDMIHHHTVCKCLDGCHIVASSTLQTGLRCTAFLYKHLLW